MAIIKTKTKTVGPKKRFTTSTIVIYAVVAFLILGFAVLLGTALDMSMSDGSVDFALLAENMNRISDNPSLIFPIRKNVPKILLFTVVAMGIFALYKYSEGGKKYHRKGEEYGSAHWGDTKEKKSLENEKKPERKSLVDDDGKKLYDEDDNMLTAIVDSNLILTDDVKLGDNTHQHRLNLNTLVQGGSGAGKTRGFTLPNILQLDTSFVVTDPKGEILQATGKILKMAGYKLKVFNLIDMPHSNNYNPFHYVYDSDGNVSEDNVVKMINTLFTNTKGDGEKDDFWAKKGQTLLQAIVFLLFEESEYNALKDENGRIIPESRDISHLNFFSVAEKMRKLSYPPKGSQVPDGMFLEPEINELPDNFEKRRNKAFLCPLDKDFIELEKRKGKNNLAVRLFKEVRNAPEETGQSFLSSANVKTFMFNLSNISNLTCCDNIHLETMGDEKSALFIIIPATDTTYNFMAAMLYTQMFDVLSNRANFKYGGTLPVHVRCIMDEFCNIGQIPRFENVIAFVRSMGMSLNVIIQNLSLLKTKYEKSWEAIISCCDSFLMLGTNEETGLKYVSELLGKETIDIKNINRTKGGKSSSSSESNSQTGRELMLPSEIQTMPITDCILMIRSHNPFYCKKYVLENHPNYNFSGLANADYNFNVAAIHAVTKEEFEKEQKEKVDTNINFSKSDTEGGEKVSLDKQVPESFNKGFPAINSKTEDAVITCESLSEELDVLDYDMTMLSNTLYEHTSGNENITNYSTVSEEVESINFGTEETDVIQAEQEVQQNESDLEPKEPKQYDEVNADYESIVFEEEESVEAYEYDNSDFYVYAQN